MYMVLQHYMTLGVTVLCLYMTITAKVLKSSIVHIYVEKCDFFYFYFYNEI